jgi:hypothetical protein
LSALRGRALILHLPCFRELDIARSQGWSGRLRPHPDRLLTGGFAASSACPRVRLRTLGPPRSRDVRRLKAIVRPELAGRLLVGEGGCPAARMS